MERKSGKRPDPQQTSASGEFARPRPMSEPVRKEGLVLDFSDLEPTTRKALTPVPDREPEEPDTARYSYIRNLTELQAMMRSSFAFCRHDEGFDPSVFADRLISLDMCTREREEPHAFYFLEDSLGNQYRLYLDPAGPIRSRSIDHERRVVFYFGDSEGHMFPLAFQKGR